MSYNIRHGEGLDGKVDLRRIADVIAKTNPDLVAIQEVDKNCKRSGNIDIAKELGEMLGKDYRFGKFMNYQGGEYGMAVLSHLPIVDTISHQLPEGSEPRCALEISVRAEGIPGTISFVGIHNDWRKEKIRHNQAKSLIQALSNYKKPIILAGDFNGERKDSSIKILENAHWQILEKNGEKTWPSDNPEVEIDFFATKNLSEISIEHSVIDEKHASDHKPIHAIITFRGECLK